MNPEPPERRPDDGSAHRDPPYQWLSALADGEPQAVDRGCALWREDREARARWHAYHLIGDVLRSDELASVAGRDVAFVATLRQRLAREPVPLAPTPAAAAVSAPAAGRGRHLGWRAPAAVAAGFAVVAGALVLTRGQPEFGSPDRTTSLAAGSGVQAPMMPAALPVNPTGPAAGQRLVLSGGQLRDPELDAYLRAHQAARGGAPTALPGGALRSVEVIVSPLPVEGPIAPSAGGRAASGAPR